MIKVKLFATLAEKSRLKKRDIEVPLDGCASVLDVVKRELPEGWEEYVMAVVNGFHVELNHELEDGDNVELMLAVSGG